MIHASNIHIVIYFYETKSTKKEKDTFTDKPNQI